MLVHTALLQNMEPESQRYLPGFAKNTPTREYLLKVISIADLVITHVNQTELLAYIGDQSNAVADISAKVKT